MSKTLTEIVEDAAGTLDKLHTLIAGDPRDWSDDRRDAWLYGVLVGWDCETDHVHDPEDDFDCANGVAMTLVAQRHGWDRDQVARLRDQRAAVRALIDAADHPPFPTPAASRPGTVIEFRAPR